MKYKIEKNTVQETLVIPLYGRKMCSRLYPSLYRDETAIQLIDQLDYDFSVLEKKSGSLMQRFGFLECAMRQNDLAFEVRDYLKTHPNAAVVNLGCGLDRNPRTSRSSLKSIRILYSKSACIRILEGADPISPYDQNNVGHFGLNF